MIADALMQDAGLEPIEEQTEVTPAGEGDYEFVLNVHDEWQITCQPGLVDTVKVCALEGMRLAGIVLGLRVVIAGEAKAGANWKETH